MCHYNQNVTRTQMLNRFTKVHFLLCKKKKKKQIHRTHQIMLDCENSWCVHACTVHVYVYERKFAMCGAYSIVCLCQIPEQCVQMYASIFMKYPSHRFNFLVSVSFRLHRCFHLFCVIHVSLNIIYKLLEYCPIVMCTLWFWAGFQKPFLWCVPCMDTS